MCCNYSYQRFILTQTRTKMLGIHLPRWAIINIITIVRLIFANTISFFLRPSTPWKSTVLTFRWWKLPEISKYLPSIKHTDDLYEIILIWQYDRRIYWISLIHYLPDIILVTDTFWDGIDWKSSCRSSAFCCTSFSNINAFKEVKTKNGTIPLNAILNPTKYIW